MDQWFREQGAPKYFDGSIMVEPPALGTPHALIYCSGESVASLQQSGVGEILSTFGAPVYFGPAPDDAATIDVAMLAGLFGMFNGALLAITLLKKQMDRRRPINGGGHEVMTMETIVAKYLNPFLQNIMPYHAMFAQAVDADDPNRNYNVPMGMASTVSNNIIRACKEEGVDSGTYKHFTRLMWRTVDEFGPDCGLSRTVSLLMRGDQDADE